MTVTTDTISLPGDTRATRDTDAPGAPDALRSRRTPAGSVRVTSTARCRCGQQLDCCARHHCPRCGRTLPES